MSAPTHHSVSGKQTSQPIRFKKRIGTTVYKVSIHFSQTSTETISSKILRLVENDMPLSSSLPERETNEQRKGHHPV